MDEAGLYLDRALDRLKTLSQTLGFTPYVIVIPDTYEVDAALLAKKAKYYRIAPDQIDIGRPHRALAQKLRQRGVPFTDALACLQADLAGAYYVQDNHLTPKGHEQLAGCLEEPLGALLRS